MPNGMVRSDVLPPGKLPAEVIHLRLLRPANTASRDVERHGEDDDADQGR